MNYIWLWLDFKVMKVERILWLEAPINTNIASILGIPDSHKSQLTRKNESVARIWIIKILFL